MRAHPIPPVTEPMQYRAIGLVEGTYTPADPDNLARGVLTTAEGEAVDAVVLGRVLSLLRRHVDLALPHLWVVYPRSRETGRLQLQLVGVWEPSTLARSEEGEAVGEAVGDAAVVVSDSLPEGDGYFSVRGELVFTRPESGDLVIKVRQKPRADGSRPQPFKIPLRGEVPLDHLRQFVSLGARRRGQQLELETLEVVGPLPRSGDRRGGRRQVRRNPGPT
ncbi:MAG: hypothetical protein ACKO2F_02105 [Cyanobacteriota bacterium]